MKVILPALMMVVLIGVPMILFGGIIARLREAGRALARMISWLSRTAACSLVVGLVTAVLAHYADLDAAATGVMVGLLSLPVTLLVARPRRSHEEARWPTAVARQAQVVKGRTPDPPLPKPNKPPRRFWFGRRTHPCITDKALEEAWAVAESLADWAPSRLAAVRTSCGALLRESDLAPLDLEAKDLAILIRRRIPELIGACADQCRDATGSERESLVEELLDSLESVGAEADRRRKQARRSRGTPFDVLRAHVGNRVKKEGWI